MIDTLVDGMVDKIDNKLLVQQVDFFAEIRHAYHEFNMVEEAIYQVAQGDSAPETSRQAEKIYEILISNDPESELEKYYDIAPNSYLKEFAGISYLTKEPHNLLLFLNFHMFLFLLHLLILKIHK